MYRNVRQAVVMVGGKGTRLRPLTYTRPKPILPVVDKPCLGYLIDALVRGGIEEIYCTPSRTSPWGPAAR